MISKEQRERKQRWSSALSLLFFFVIIASSALMAFGNTTTYDFLYDIGAFSLIASLFVLLIPIWVLEAELAEDYRERWKNGEIDRSGWYP